MKSRRRKVINVAVILILAFIVLNLSWFLNPIGYIRQDVRKGKQRQKRLLCETDFQELLDACRRLSDRVAAGDFKPQQYNVRGKPHPESSRFPKAILDLEPTYIIINTHGEVMMELHGGFLHYGVIGYPEDYKKFSGAEYGDIKLIDGLWYFNEDYKGNPKVQKQIKELLQKRNKQ